MKHRRPVDSLPVHCFYHWYKRIHGHVQVQYRVEFYMYHRVESLPLLGPLLQYTGIPGSALEVWGEISSGPTCLVCMVYMYSFIWVHVSCYSIYHGRESRAVDSIMSQGACTGRAGTGRMKHAKEQRVKKGGNKNENVDRENWQKMSQAEGKSSAKLMRRNGNGLALDVHGTAMCCSNTHYLQGGIKEREWRMQTSNDSIHRCSQREGEKKSRKYDNLRQQKASKEMNIKVRLSPIPL